MTKRKILVVGGEGPVLGALPDKLRKMGYDVPAVASHRPYRAALGWDVATDEIIQKRGICYDEDIVDACLNRINKGEILVN